MPLCRLIGPWLGCGEPVHQYDLPPALPSEGYADVTFADDNAISVHARSNDRIRCIVHEVVQCLAHATGKRGLEINFDKGKTELLWNVLGKGARATKLALHSDGNNLKCFMGFCSTISTGPFSIATLNIQRVDS